MRKKDSHDLRRSPKSVKSNSGHSEQGCVAVLVALIYSCPSVEDCRHRLWLNGYRGYHQGGPTRFISGIHVLFSL